MPVGNNLVPPMLNGIYSLDDLQMITSTSAGFFTALLSGKLLHLLGHYSFHGILIIGLQDIQFTY